MATLVTGLFATLAGIGIGAVGLVILCRKRSGIRNIVYDWMVP